MYQRNGVCSKLWIALLKEGGRATVSEMLDLVLHDCDPVKARTVIYGMAKNGTLRRFAPASGILGAKFGVTADCKVPFGVTVADILACNNDGQADKCLP